MNSITGNIPKDLMVQNFNFGSSLTSCKGTIRTRKLVVCDLTIPGGTPGSVLVNTGSGRAAWSSAPLTTATINTGVTPTGLAITSDGAFAYVANNNNYGITTGNYVSLLNLTTNMPEMNIFSGTFNQPYTVTLSTDETKAYITNSAGSTLSVIDTATNQVTGTIGGSPFVPFFDGPSGLAINGTTGYVNNYGSTPGAGSGNGTTISVVNLITETLITTITVDLAPAAVALSIDGSLLYVVNYVTGATGSGTMQIIDTTTNTLLPVTITGFSGPFGIVMHPNGNFAYVSNFGSNNFDPYGSTVSVVNLNSNTIVATIDVGIQPSGIAVTPDGKYVYVSNYNTLYMVGSPTFSGLTAGEGTVNIIDTSTNELLPITIVVGQSPSNITISPSGDLAYVSNFTSGTVSVIRTVT